MSFIEIEYRKQTKECNTATLHTHNFYEIYFLLKGDRNVFVEDKIFTLHKNCITVIPPFQMHKTEGGPYTRINLYISPDLLEENEKKFLDSYSSVLAFQLDEAKNKTIISLLRPFFSSNHKKYPLREKYLLPFAKTFLFFLQTSALTPLSYSLNDHEHNGDKNLILEIVAYINTHFAENITLPFIQNKFFISKNTLCKKFHQVMQCSVIEYCSAIRLNEAKHLLLTTNKSIEDIADLCGYSSANYFSLFFKSKTGISPSNYRKKK